MTISPVDIVSIIALFQLFVFASFLFRRKSNRQANRMLGIFLFSQFMIILDFESYHLPGHPIIESCPFLFLVGTPFFFLVGPSFYFYVRSLAFSDFRLRKKHFFHALPFVLCNALFAFEFYFLPVKLKLGLYSGTVPFPAGYWIVYNVVVFVHLFAYFLADLRILKHYRSEIREQYSSITRINLSWLTFILYAFIIAWLTSVAQFLSRNYFSKFSEELQLMNFLAFFFFFNYIFYKGLSRPEIFAGVEEKQKYLSSKLTDEEAQKYLSKLSSCMEADKPYLNPDLTLKDLAEQLTIPARYLSQIINDKMNQSFYDYISVHRIKEAKKILSEDSVDKTVLEVLYEVGFNSKSSFNTAFKKFTGVTPTHFRNHLE